MASSQKIINCSKFKPNNALKKNGIIWNRFVFTGLEVSTGAERLFFIELEMLNASLATENPILGFKTRTKISEEDLQYALAGTKAAHDLQAESIVTPSYVAVRAGAFGRGAKQICNYYSLKNVSGGFKLSPIEAGPCVFSDDRLSGSVSCSSTELIQHPEYLCDEGEVRWDLRYEIQFAFPQKYKEKNEAWIPAGAKTSFAGSISFDGHDYRVVPKSSCGYIDINFMRTLPAPYFHMSSSNLTSRISGKTLFNSCFVVQGLYADRLALVVKLEDIDVTISAKEIRSSSKPLWSCAEMPADEEGDKLHWSVSADTKKWVVDIDVTCYTSQLFVRNIELPEGKRRVMKLLAGGTGVGEVRLYRHVGKNLEIIEDAHIAGALCEFGQAEEGEL
ncbi:MAG: hypothetical protein J6I73_01250 [Treponema sp.]|nr:hypothetical protein [Treponema sp.]